MWFYTQNFNPGFSFNSLIDKPANFFTLITRLIKGLIRNTAAENAAHDFFTQKCLKGNLWRKPFAYDSYEYWMLVCLPSSINYLCTGLNFFDSDQQRALFNWLNEMKYLLETFFLKAFSRTDKIAVETKKFNFPLWHQTNILLFLLSFDFFNRP